MLRRTAIRRLLLASVVTSQFVGCSSPRNVWLRATPRNPLADVLMLNRHQRPRTTERTTQFLRQHDLAEQSGERRLKKPTAMLAAAERIYSQEQTADACFAVAELSYIVGEKRKLRNRHEARGLLLLSLSHAYTYLFDDRFAKNRNAYDPRFRKACEIYNSALEDYLRLAVSKGRLRTGRRVELANFENECGVDVVPCRFRWDRAKFSRFEFTSDYDLVGLNNHHRRFGLGVPLIAVRDQQHNDGEQHSFDSGLSFAVTAFLRPGHVNNDGSVTSPTLELYDPLTTNFIAVADQAVPLQSDMSTPLAYALDKSKFRNFDTLGLIRSDRAQKQAGLYMVRPYQPGKIPIVLIHGIWSSPMTWMQALNELQSDPEIREKYQFWFYLYPTGVPFLEASAKLRMELAEMRQTFDADRSEPALDRMVLVGHSMGGLIARSLATDSGDRVWNSISSTPIEQVGYEAETVDAIRNVYFFEPESSITRVITIGSPHRGSPFAAGFVRWLGRRFISLPKSTAQLAMQLLIPNRKNGDPSPSIPRTSVDTLSKNSPILKAMYDSTQSPFVKHHNIVGVSTDNWLFGRGDGVVPYHSAHLEDVASELVVESRHSKLHQHPRTMLEIIRILRDHASNASEVRLINQQESNERPVLH